MSEGVGTWSPEGAVNVPSIEALRAAAAAWIDEGEALIDRLPDTPMAALCSAMRLPEGAIDDRIAALEDRELDALARFFTLAEARHAAWEAGARSPVVALYAQLRARGVEVAELGRWIRAHTENRFLPRGSLQARLRGG
ncbi:MAG: hypothetical protein V2I63_11205 [Pseudomonadales bacterium]|jgi:hypothetical protein|nr:hypothetical protein [Pseudomonadales bacterium]